MKISTTTSQLFRTFGYKEGIKVAAEVGFDALDLNLIHPIYSEDFSDENLESTCTMLREEAEKNGIFFNQAHAPFPSRLVIEDKQRMTEYNEKVAPKIISAIRAAGIVGAAQIIVHPIDCTAIEEIDQKKYNIDFYNGLVPYCKEYNIKVALENMWTTKKENGVDTKVIIPNVCSFANDLADYYDALDPRYFTVCLDLGHCALVGEKAEDAIVQLGHERLHALHVHDNDWKWDQHTIPYLGKNDWDAVVRALKEIDYDGVLTYEVGGPMLDAYGDKPEVMKKVYGLLAAVGKHLVNL